MLERFRPMIRVVGIAAALLLALSIVFQAKPPLPAGSTAPPIVGITLASQPFDLSTYRGQVVVVNVWASWCAPCLMEIPDLVAFSKSRTDVAVVGLAAESSIADAQRIVAKLAVPYPNLVITAAQQAAWHVEGLPSTFIINSEGRVYSSVAGAITRSQLEAMVAAATEPARR